VVLGAHNSYGESVLAIVKFAEVEPDWKHHRPYEALRIIVWE
jgi:hypothetical protein